MPLGLSRSFAFSPLPSLRRCCRPEAPDRPVLLIDIKGAIGFVSAGQLTKALERAAAQGAPAVIVRLDTPGGLL